MTRNFFFAIALIITISNVNAQSFEGVITYQNTYKSKVPSFTDQQWQSIVGSQNEYYIKGGNYKSVMNGSVIASYLYLSKDNKLYSEFQDGNIMYWSDASINKDSVISFELKKNAVRILSYNCDELILHTRQGTEVYDFAPGLVVDPTLYAHHNFGNWNYYLKIAKAMPLRMVIEQDQVIITSEATSVRPLKLDSDFFLLPADINLVKSPY